MLSISPKSLLAKLAAASQTLQQWISSMPIKLKMTVIIGLIVFSTVAILSFLVYRSSRDILLERLQDTCDLLASNLSEYTREGMLLETAGSSAARDRIQDVVLRFKKLDIEGFEYAAVVSRSGTVIAHTDYTLRGTSLNSQDSSLVSGLEALFWREVGDTSYEYFQPIFATKRTQDRTRKLLLGAAIIGFSKNELWTPLRQAQNALFGAVAAVIVLSAFVIYMVSHRMTAQIGELSEGARQVGDGNLEVHIPVHRSDELGRLAEDFNHMVGHLRERLHMQKFVSKLTVDMIRKRAALGDPHDERGETRNVTILFSDIRNFSALTEKLSPQEVVNLINIYLDLQAQTVEENQGVVDKFIGDQIMGIFLGEKMADKATHAAVEIQRAIRSLNTERGNTDEVVLEVGIGLNDGPAVVGNMGSKNRMDYTVIGDVVNVASRLCALAKPGQIIAPMNLVQSLFSFYPIVRLDPISIKGRTTPVEIFEIDYNRSIIM